MHRGHVVNPDDLNPLPGQRHRHADRARRPLLDRTAEQFREKPFPGMTDQHWPADPVQAVNRGKQVEIVSGSLAETDARIKDHPLGRQPGRHQVVKPAFEITPDVPDHVLKAGAQ